MTEQRSNIIKSQRFQVSLHNEQIALSLQDRLSKLQELQLNRLLDQILNYHSSEDEVLLFDQIQLNLGSIGLENFESEVATRLEEELTNFLNSNILDNGRLRHGKKIILNDHRIELFEFFLLKGYLNWHVPNLETPEKLLQELASGEPTQLALTLQKHGKKSFVRTRLVTQFEDANLEQIVNIIAGNDGKYIIDYKNETLRTHRANPITDRTDYEFRNAVWEVILAYLFVGSRSYHSRKSFLQYFIKNLSNSLRINYLNFLDAIVHGIQVAELNNEQHLQFKQLILELKAEEETKTSSYNENKVPSQEAVNSEILVAVVHYLRYGSISASLTDHPKPKLIRELNRVVKGNPKVATSLLNEMLLNASRSRIIELVDRELMQYLISQTTNSYLKTLQKYAELFVAKSSGLSSKSSYDQLVTVIKQELPYILLEAFPGNPKPQPSDLWLGLFYAIRSLSTIDDKEVIKLFHELIKLPELKFKKPLEQFLKTISNQSFPEPEHFDSHTARISFQKGSLQFTGVKKIINLLKEVQSTGLSLDLPEIRLEIINLVQKHELNSSEGIQFLLSQIEHHDFEGTVFKSIRSLIETETSRTESIPLSLSSEDNTSLNKAVNLKAEHMAREFRAIWNKSINRELKQLEIIYYINSICKLNHTQPYVLLKAVIARLLQATQVEPSNSLQEMVSFLRTLKTSTIKTDKDIASYLHNTRFQRDLMQTIIETNQIPWWANNLAFRKIQEISSLAWKRSKSRLTQLVIKQKNIDSLLMISDDDLFIQLVSAIESRSNIQHKTIFKQLVSLHGMEAFLTGISQHAWKTIVKQVIWATIQSQAASGGESSYFNFITESIASKLNIDKRELLHVLGAYSTKHATNADTYSILKWLKSQNSKKTGTSLHRDNGDLEKLLTRSHSSLSGNEVGEMLYQKLKEASLNEGNMNVSWYRNVAEQSQVRYFNDYQVVTLIKLHLDQYQKTQFDSVTSVLIEMSRYLTKAQYSAIRNELYTAVFFFIGSGHTKRIDLLFWINLLFNSMRKHLADATLSQLLPLIYHEEPVHRLQGSLTYQIVQNIYANARFIGLAKKLPKKHITVTNQLEQIQLEIDNTQQLDVNTESAEDTEEDIITPEEGESIFLSNAGIVILSPYIPMLFERLELLQSDGSLKNEQCEDIAIHLLQYLCTGQSNCGEHEMVLNKILCGVKASRPITKSTMLTKEQKEMADSMLEAVIQQWSAIKNTSVEGLRESFLKRQGRLIFNEDFYVLRVEQKPFDMLLDQIPWSFNKVKLSWMNKMISVEWR